MTLEHFKDVAAAIESIAIAVAVLGGGAWALYRFFSLRAIEQARADLEQARRSLRERGVLELTMHAEQITSALGHFIAVRVTLKNVGSGSETIQWSSNNLRATKVVSIEDGLLQYSKENFHGQRNVVITDSTLRPEEILTVPLLIPVPEPGIYYLDFFVQCSSQTTKLILEERERAGVVDPGTIAWGAGLFFHVQNTTV